MAIEFQQDKQLFTLNTKHTTYQMKVDRLGFLLHLYYGERISGNMDYLLTYYDRGDRKSTRLNSSHITRSRMPSSA